MSRIDWNAIQIGDKIRSLTEWCLQTGVDRETAYKRINDLGWPAAQAVGLEPRVRGTWAEKSRFHGRRDVLVKYREREHTLKEWHEISKTWDRPIPYRTLVDRYNRGYQPEDLFDTRRQTRAVLQEKKVKRLSRNWSEDDVEWTPDAVDS
jgi:hypothetical protein